MIKNINADQAKEEFDKGTEFIDVREYDEFVEVRIPGSKLIPMSEMNARIQEIPKDVDVVVYCRSGARSANLLSQLYPMGYENLVNLKDGIIEWSQKQYPVESGEPEENKTV